VTPEELSRQVRASFVYAAHYLSVLASTSGSVTAVLSRPDVTEVLQQALDSARELAQDAVRQAWGGGPEAQYLQWLLSDVERSYLSLSLLRAEVRVAWLSAEPGTRASAVSRAVMDHAAGLALRNRLSAEVAAVAARTEAQLASGEQRELAGERVWKQWLCRTSPPDPQTCHWCRALHGMVVPLGEDFPAGDPVDLTGHGRLTHPPRLYHGILRGPPRHPHCRCRIVVTTSLPGGEASSEAHGSQEPPVPVTRTAAHPGFLAAADIREMPEARYQAVLHFAEAAVHEFGQLLARLREVLSGR
jgi:hypothetical protein